MSKRYRAINFDIDTKAMQKEIGSKTKGYRMLKSSMKILGFEHRQGSGYVSKNGLDTQEIYNVIDKLVKIQPWLTKCINKFDTTIVSKQSYDYAGVIREMGNEKKINSITALPKQQTLADYKASIRQPKDNSKANVSNSIDVLEQQEDDVLE